MCGCKGSLGSKHFQRSSPEFEGKKTLKIVTNINNILSSVGYSVVIKIQCFILPFKKQRPSLFATSVSCSPKKDPKNSTNVEDQCPSETSPHVLASFSESERAAVHRSLKISLPVLCLLQELHDLSRLQREVSGVTGLVRQLHTITTAVPVLVAAFLL